MFDELKQKSLRIAEALYRTTDLFSDTEPLKWSLRSTALDILNARVEDFLRLEALVKDISLKLDLASSGTFVSKINFEVIKKAYGGLLNETMSVRNGYRSLLDGIMVSDEKIKAISDKKVEASASVEAGVENRLLQVSDRQTTLLSALKQKSPMGVGGLTKILSESGVSVSEKTVQREMLALVATGAIKQEGDKRWRRYFIG